MCIEEDRNSPALLYCGPLVEGGNCVHRSRVLCFTGIVDFSKKNVCTSSPSRQPVLTYTQAGVQHRTDQRQSVKPISKQFLKATVFSE